MVRAERRSGRENKKIRSLKHEKKSNGGGEQKSTKNGR
jgi:hypothetical protein